MGPAVAFTPQLGPMLKDKEATTGYDLYLAAENEEDLAEMNRLFYVAATRAADYLILSAGVENPAEPQGPWMQLLARQFDLFNGGPLVRATTAAPVIQSKPVDLRRRRDLLKIIEKARQMAADGSGKAPRYLEAVPHDAAARRQYSFSRLTGMLHGRAPPLGAEPLDGDAPAEPPLDPRGLGTLVHAVLAEVDFARPGDVEELVRRHAPEHLPEAEGGLDEPIEMVRRFLASPRVAEIVAAGEVHAEIEFLLAWPPDDPQPGGRYLQGFLDCLYRDAAGQWHVIDYKTNRVAKQRIGAVAAEYEMQMLVYALAVEQILKRPPAEVALCFLRPGLEHRFPWDDAARRRAVELVNAALP
jgi:ATP-dependent helicase/nuclease subunit A